jgi:hypothetical protein
MECLFHTESKNVAAYCKYHKCGMTVKQMKCKNCLGKQCYYLVKNEQHDYWRQRSVIKQKRIERKNEINMYIESILNNKTVV